MHDWGGIVVAEGNRSKPGDVSDVAPWLVPVVNRPLLHHAIDETTAAGAAEVAVVAAGLPVATPVRETIPAGLPDSPTVVVGAADADVLSLICSAREELGCHYAVVHAADALVEGDLHEARARIDGGSADAAVVTTRERAAQSGTRFRRAVGAGVLLLGPQALDRLVGAARDGRQARDLEAVADMLTADELRVDAVTARAAWRHRPGGEALLEAHRLVLDRLAVGGATSSPDADSRVHGRVVIDPSAIVRRSVIRGPAVIDREARILDAYVGPYTAIGARACVEATEVEHSVLYEDCELRHVGYRIEGSVIGAGARVSRSFELPKALHLEIGSSARVIVS